MTKQYTIRQGDCLNSISEKHGLFWQTVWDAPGNKALKKLRKDPNILLPGDKLSIPKIREKIVDCASGTRHSFRKKGVPAKIKVQLVMEDEPMKNQPFSMIIDDQFWSEGTTDGDGYIETNVPPQVKMGKIIVGPPANRVSFGIDFGTLDPLDTEEGVLKRLSNMGYEVADEPRGAIEAFQDKEKLTVTGKIDQATRDRIKEVFGQ